MTPIKIPGKNRRDQRRSVLAANVKKPSRPPGRPPKSSASYALRDPILASVEPGRSAKRRSLITLKSRRKMSKLELLPTEILTAIFLFSLNLNLPTASPTIAGKLSSRLTFAEAIRNAFSPTWKYYYNVVRGSEPQKPAPGDPKLQSAILRCRFAHLSILRQTEAVWLRSIAVENGSKSLSTHEDFAGDHSMGHKDHLSMDCSRRESEPQQGSNVLIIEEHRRRWRDKIIDDCFTEDYAEFRQLSDESAASKFFPRWPWSGFLRMHADFDIPESLLQGPWAEDMVEYLFWLTRAGARIRWIGSTNGEVALLGLKNAVLTGNLQILYIFQYLGLAHYITQEMLEWANVHAGGDKVEVVARLTRIL